MTAIVLAVLVFSLIAASAASLGGINSDDVGADVAVVASCEGATPNGVTASYATSYSGGEYVIESVTIGDIAAACAGQAISVTLTDGGAVLETLSDVVGGVSVTLATTGAVSAEDLDGIAVVISG
jgi:hypothetical protein